MPSDVELLVLCVVFRVANSVLVRTYFNPDEYWQSVEVSHRLVFGSGHLYVVWRWVSVVVGLVVVGLVLFLTDKTALNV